MARRKEPAPGKWTYTVGNLTAIERKDRGFAVYTRVYDPARKSYKNKSPLCGTIRDENGRIDGERETAAQALVLERHAEMVAGTEREASKKRAPVTLITGFAALLDEKNGKYASNSQARKDMLRYSVIVLEWLDNIPWAQLKHAHYRTLWRALAAEHIASGRYGVRTAELVVGALQTATNWLQAEELIPAGAGQPARRWKEIMRQEWAEKTGRPIPKQSRPKTPVAEVVKLWAALPKADPRVEMAVQIGAELRLGQVPRSKRSDLHPHGGHDVGKVEVHGKGKKLGEVVVLTDQVREVIVRALETGYLADLEAAFKAGEIKDFFLIPGGRLKRGRARVKHGAKPWQGMRKAWYRLEEIAGVKHLKGRNWYGFRRTFADLAEDNTNDARVLRKLGGWSNDATRRRYQEEGRSEIAEGAAKVRDLIRPKSVSSNDMEGVQP